jgi:hypothetical protein
VIAWEAATAPAIDGVPDDACWQEATWYHIDQTWIPWGGSVDSADYFGRFKVSWSETENLLYFFVEITDDVFVDGYVYPNNGYPNFDIVELFLDEDRSGGLHVFDNNPDLGMNSENAFSYHLAVNAPAEGEVENGFVACDIDGTGWGDRVTIDYAGHFPELALKREGNRYLYEFSVKVYDDTYDHSDPELSRAVLTGDKEMGMSLAYCENDTPGTDRDNFFGSVWVPEAEYNDHWMNADGYGLVKLLKSGTSGNHALEVRGSIPDFEIVSTGTDLVIHSDLREVFYDPDGDVLTYTVHCDHAALSFLTTDNVLTVNATEEFSGESVVEVVATDGEFEASVTFTVTRDDTGTGVSGNGTTVLRCYPNPFNDMVNIEPAGVLEEVTLTVYDLSGRILKSRTAGRIGGSSGAVSLDLGDYPEGTYLLQVQAEGFDATFMLYKR